LRASRKPTQEAAVHAAIVNMLNMQYRMNTRVHEAWIDQNFEWYRAIWIECGELMDHVGYKWWKHQEPEMEQVRLEVVDIWHFGLSALFRNGITVDELARQIELDLYHAEAANQDVRLATEALAQHALEHRGFSVTLFANLMFAVDMSFDELYRHYVGKNVLNFFRQDHGYKAGTYVKVWDGREDNEHLTEVLASIEIDAEDFPDQVYAALASRYPA
jgi:dimeric dUTPase (all-alpha-NTP-PPase superfamily)